MEHERIGKSRPLIILMADDDLDDQRLTKEAFEDCHLPHDLRFVDDGEQLLDYLRRKGKYANDLKALRPGLILLDLNMPGMDGRQALQEIKNDPLLRQIPIIVWSTSLAEEDVYASYGFGVNSYIRKPITFEALVKAVQTLGEYWFGLVELPPAEL